MGTKVEFSCSGCPITGNIELDMNVETLNVGGEININQPCPQCGGKLGAPGGKYKKNAEGTLVRIGDYEPVKPAV